VSLLLPGCGGGVVEEEDEREQEIEEAEVDDEDVISEHDEEEVKDAQTEEEEFVEDENDEALFPETEHTVNFATRVQGCTEDTGSITITIQLSTASGGDVIVPFTLSGSAMYGEDYLISSSPIIITAGTTTAYLTINVIDDTIDEPDETIIITMGTPTNASKGDTDRHTATIQTSDTRESITWNGYAVTTDEVISDKVISCTGDIIIRNGGNLTLDYVNLTIGYSSDNHYGIYVEPGGSLRIINNSVVTCSDMGNGYYEFWYKGGSSGEILESAVKYTWTPNPNGNSQFGEAGMFIEADNFHIFNSSIENSRGNGIEAYQAHNFVAEFSSFIHNSANGLLIRNSENITVSGCELSNNGADIERTDGCGMIVIAVDGTISENTIENNRYTGMEGSGGMDLTISNNTARNNGHFGIFFHDEFSTSTVEVCYNTCESNGLLEEMPGISIENAVYANVHNNTFNKNGMGIRVLSNSLSSRFHENTVNDNISNGIHVDNANPIFYRNTVVGNDRAVFVQENIGVPSPNFGDLSILDSGLNDFSNNNVGIHNLSSARIKAENNYWGYTTEADIINYNINGHVEGEIFIYPWLSSVP
jgi:parallel beta-helix repeat protein